jgi:hypothetical protein
LAVITDRTSNTCIGSTVRASNATAKKEIFSKKLKKCFNQRREAMTVDSYAAVTALRPAVLQKEPGVQITGADRPVVGQKKPIGQGITAELPAGQKLEAVQRF